MLPTEPRRWVPIFCDYTRLRRPKFQFLLHRQLAVWSWASYLISLSLPFLPPHHACKLQGAVIFIKMSDTKQSILLPTRRITPLIQLKEYYQLLLVWNSLLRDLNQLKSYPSGIAATNISPGAFFNPPDPSPTTPSTSFLSFSSVFCKLLFVTFPH